MATITATPARTQLFTQTSAISGPIVLLGRVFFGLIFILAGPNNFSSQTIAYSASHGVPLASLAVPFSAVLAILGGLSILLGYRANRSMAHRAVPDRSDSDVAQLLGRFRSDGAPDAVHHVYEERINARRRVADLATWRRPVEPGFPRPEITKPPAWGGWG